MKSISLALLMLVLPPMCAARAGADVPSEDARRDQMRRLADRLPTDFRFEITYDEYRDAAVAEPKCVAQWLEDVWREMARRPNTGQNPLVSTIAVRVPTVTKLVTPFDTEFTTIRLWHDRLQFWSDWFGEIERRHADGEVFTLPMTIPRCRRRDVNTFLYRTRHGQMMSPEQWDRYRQAGAPNRI